MSYNIPNSYGTSGSMASQTLESIFPPQIIGQPVIQVVEPGVFVTFSVVVSDASGVVFQWKFNDTDIPGVMGDSLLLTNVSAANEGQYSVIVTNSAGSVTSIPAAQLLGSDSDGLPDSWEIANFNFTSQHSEGNPDSDRISNLDEFIDSTNPNSKAFLQPRFTKYSYANCIVTDILTKLNYASGEAPC